MTYWNLVILKERTVVALNIVFYFNNAELNWENDHLRATLTIYPHFRFDKNFGYGNIPIYLFCNLICWFSLKQAMKWPNLWSVNALLTFLSHFLPIHWQLQWHLEVICRCTSLVKSPFYSSYCIKLITYSRSANFKPVMPEWF